MKKIICLVLLLVTSGIVFAAGQQDSDEITSDSTVSGGANGVRRGEYAEAPSLAQLADEGRIPPLAERLPENPMVVEATELGYYGTFFSVIDQRGGQGRVQMLNAEMPWVEPDPENINNIRPALAENIIANDDSTEYTFTLRKGLKWSDGHPYTSADVEFFFEDLIKDNDINGASIQLPDASFSAVRVDVIDERTFVLKFDKPNGLALQQLATIRAKALVLYPAHYAKQFMPKYNSEVPELAKEEGFASVAEYFAAKCPTIGGLYNNADRPVLSAWMPVENFDDTKNIYTLKRNPYYWRVDQEGQQLPYLDELRVLFSDDINSIILRIANGEVDFRYQLGGISAKPILVENAEKSGIKVFDIEQDWGPIVELGWNLNTENETLRKVVNEKDFRIAMSLGINREEINEGVFLGLSEPYQMAPRPETSLYDPDFAKMHTEYDPARANTILDNLGLDKRDNSGFRLMENGERLSFILHFNNNQNAWIGEVYEYIRTHWQEIGVELILSPSKTVGQIRNSGDFDFWAQTGPNNWIFLNPKGFIPVNSSYFVDGGRWTAYWKYMQNGVESENMLKPPPSVMRALELYQLTQKSPNPEERLEYMREVIDIAKENFFKIGVLKGVGDLNIFREEMRNIPEQFLKSWTKSAPFFTQPYTWWKE